MAKRSFETQLSRRERQIMDVLWERETATAKEIWRQIPDPPTYSSVRGTLRTLTTKGYVTYEEHGPRYVYRPTIPAQQAQRTALERLVKIFFGGNAEHAVAALLDVSSPNLTDSDFERLERLIEQAREDAKR